MITRRYCVYVNNQLMTRTLTQHKAIRLVNDYIKRGINASYAMEVL